MFLVEISFKKIVFLLTNNKDLYLHREQVRNAYCSSTFTISPEHGSAQDFHPDVPLLYGIREEDYHCLQCTLQLSDTTKSYTLLLKALNAFFFVLFFC